MQGSTAACVDHYMIDIVKDESWTGAEQWIVDPLSFKGYGKLSKHYRQGVPENMRRTMW